MTFTHALLRASFATSVSLSLLAGCAQPPGAPTMAATGAKAPVAQAPAAAQPAAPVTAKVPAGAAAVANALGAISDQKKQAVGAALSSELGMSLRAERTMRDAELLANGGGVAAAYSLMADDDAEDEADDAEDEADDAADDADDDADEADDDKDEADDDDAATGAEADDDADDDKDEAEDDDEDEDEDHEQGAKRAEKAAKAAWKQLSEVERKLIKKSLEGREAKLLAKLGMKLEQKKKLFAKQGTDTVVAGADGGKDVTTTFAVTTPEGSRTVTVTRKYDAAGMLVQAVQTLAGTVGTTTYAATRTRTINPDGSVSIVSDTTLTVDGQASVIHWEKTIAPDGTLTATGTLTRADGTTVALSSKGTEDGIETIAGSDAGVAVTLEADADSDQVTATVEAGADGSAVVKLDGDDDSEDEDEDEADGDDDEADDDQDEADDDKDEADDDKDEADDDKDEADDDKDEADDDQDEADDDKDEADDDQDDDGDAAGGTDDDQ